MEAEENWEMFLEIHCSDDGVITDTLVYSAIADRFPIQLTHKLISTALNAASPNRDRAALLIEDMTQFDRLDTAYPTINVNTELTLPYFRRSAINLMVLYEAGSPLQVAGKELTKKLVSLSLQHNDGWDGFLGLMQRAFSTQRTRVLDLILDVFCEVDEDDELRDKFAAFLEPTVRANAHQFHTRLLNLLALQQGHDDRAYKILPFFYRIFTHPDHRSTLMEGAIMSPFFDYNPHPHPEKMLGAAISVKLCIERGAAFRFSSAMIRKVNGIILRLNWSLDPRDRRAAKQLVIAITRRLEWLIPRKCRGRRRGF